MPSRPTVRAAGPMPAELTRIRSGASSPAASTAAVICGGVGHVDVDERAAQLVGQRLALVVLHVGDHDRRAGGGEAAGDGGADARRGPGDEG